MFEDFNPGSSSCFDDTSNPNFQPGNCTYESYMDYGTRGTELVKEFHLDSGPSITKFCLDDNQEVCTDGGGGDLIALDVAFSRANSAANLIGYAPNGGQYFPLSVIFHIKGFGEGEKCVVIRRSGQISIPQICP
jgi:hypothetical protein